MLFGQFLCFCEVAMNSEYRPSIWFYIGVASLTLALGPFVLGFLAVMTWGLIYLPVVALIWFGPWLLLHWVLWGRGFSQQVAEDTEGAEVGVAVVPVQRPTGRLKALRLIGGVAVVLGVALYYLTLFGALNGSGEPGVLVIESRPDGTIWLRDVTYEQ